MPKKTAAQLQREIDEALQRETSAPTPAGSSRKTDMETKRELAALRKEFEKRGGRGVDLAERIDELEADLARTATREAATKLVGAAQKAHKGPWRTDLVVTTLKKLWGRNAVPNAKKVWLYSRDDARDSLSAGFWADIYLNKLGGMEYA